MLISGLIVIFFITVQQIHRLIVTIRGSLCHLLIMRLGAPSIIWTRLLQLSACDTSILGAAVVQSRGRQAMCCCHRASRELLRIFCQRVCAAQGLLASTI